MPFNISDVISGGTAIADYFGGKSSNKANINANNQNVAAQAANQEKALQANTGSTDFSTTTRNADGGFDTNQIGGGFAAGAREAQAFGDVGRANKTNELTSGAKPTFNSLQDAIAFRRPDIDIQKGIFNDKAGESTAATIRRFGAGNSGFSDANNSNLFDLNKQFDFGENVGGLDLYNKQGSADSSNLAAAIANQRSQAGGPGFNDNNAGGAAAQLIAQTPPAGTIPDLGGAVGASALSNLGSSVNARIAQDNAQEQQNKFLDALLRQQGNQGAV